MQKGKPFYWSVGNKLPWFFFSHSFLFLTLYRLKALQARDLAKLNTEKARNSLESHIFEFKDKLTNDDVQVLSTVDERTKIEEALSAASEWLDEEGFDADEEV